LQRAAASKPTAGIQMRMVKEVRVPTNDLSVVIIARSTGHVNIGLVLYMMQRRTTKAL